jgi:hypothetical protein
MTGELRDRVDREDQEAKPRVIAFYLPQFHPTPENDTWWPRGFTEWRNVARAKPLFEGHQQPHVPGELGFYDLRVPEVRVLQAELARGYGIEGFCYYHYWFKGRRVLQRPFHEVLTSGEPDFPFCLAWANENWTRAWDAGPQEVLIEQTYDAEDDRRHIDYLIRAFKDPRYIRVDGRPLLLIYRVQGMPDPVRTFDLWRDRARAAGIDDLYIVKFDTHGNFESPEGFGADAAAEFVPHGVYENVRLHRVRDSHRGNALFRYIDVASFFSRRPSPDWKRFPCVMPGWDNTPRRPDGGVLAVVGNDPELYAWWLSNAVDRARTVDPENPLVFVNAWNEWAEGCHLEPDERFGRAFLEATSNVVGGPGRPVHESRDARPPTFAELYFDLYEEFMEVQHTHTEFLATFGRRVEAAVREVNRELERSRDENARLVALLERFRHDANGARQSIRERA